MPINPNSRMRKTRKALHGWRDGERYFLSLEPRGAKRADDSDHPANAYETAQEALREASRRSVPIIWEDPEAIAS